MNRFTEPASEVMALSKATSSGAGAPYTGSEHVLYAMCCVPGCAAYKLLTARGITKESVLSLIPSLNGCGSRTSECGYSVRLHHILNSASENAIRHGSSRIGTEHILLCTISENECVAAKIITAHNVKLSSLFTDITAVISTRSLCASKSNEKQHTYLKKYGRDLCALARQGELMPCIGRGPECDKIMRILCRKTKNDPCLLGEAGVGKTAVVEAVATMLANNEVPPRLAGKNIYEINISSVLSGCKYRGDFEEKFNGIINDAINDKNAILFIDELHTIAGAGGAEGAVDAANMIKPALGRGELNLIGATTYSEYEKYINSDAALSRRFQPVFINEPDRASAYEMMRGIRSVFEEHHGVEITDDAIVCAVDMSLKYMKNRRLPDKAIDIIDEASADKSLNETNGRVTPEDVKKALYEMTGMKGPEQYDAQKLKTALNSRVIGQTEAVGSVVDIIVKNSTVFNKQRGPFASFLFCGPSGVGKTELCRALSEQLYNGKMLRLDMSEYSERHTVSRLIGSPPGYVGYGDGGSLTSYVRKNPSCLICFDEAEKAHPDVYGLLLQMTEEGELTDGEGRKADMSGCIIVLTANDNGEKYKPVSGFVSQAGRTRSVDFLKTELLGRLDGVINFNGIDKARAILIIDKILSEIKKGNACVEFCDGVSAALSDMCDLRHGVRGIKRLITEKIEIPLSSLFSQGHRGVKICTKGKDIEYITE